MPLVYIHGMVTDCAGGVQPVLVFTEAGKPVGLAVDEIVDIVEERLDIELKAETPGVIGAAIVYGLLNVIGTIAILKFFRYRDLGRLAPDREEAQ